MGVSYGRLWKILIDKNMKRIEMQYLTGISGNILARMHQKLKKITRRILHKSLGSEDLILKNLNPGNTAKTDISYKGSFPLRHRCLSPKFVIEYLRYKHIG